VTHGLYIDEFGALFSFEASLVDRDEETPWPDGMEGYSFDTDENGNVIIRRTKPPKGKGPETPTPPTPPKPGETPKATPAPRAWIDREAGKQARLYETGKAEIIDTLIEYGDSMDGLRDNQWLCFAAFLKNSDFFLENRISRLVIKAKMSDLRSYAQGRIDRKAMVAKVVQEEY
jgi:hypothetical protein